MSRRYKHRPARQEYSPWIGNRGGEKAVPIYRAERLPLPAGVRLVKVWVEGYDDVAFWRGIFDDYESDRLRFEIKVPERPDLAKGKKVLLGMAGESGEGQLLCMDSDFDYLFGDHNDQSRLVTGSPYMFHTYAYATENYLCYAPSLHAVCVKATKNDVRIFDFESFLAGYSRIIYPLFVWYVLSAYNESQNFFTLLEFKTSVKLNYLEVEHNGRGTLDWLDRQIDRKLAHLRNKHPEMDAKTGEMDGILRARGVVPHDTYLYMQGHTLLDNVVIVMLHAVCEQLKLMSSDLIRNSVKTGVALRNEQSNYANAQRSVRDILMDNEGYKDCPLYHRLKSDIEKYIANLEIKV